MFVFFWFHKEVVNLKQKDGVSKKRERTGLGHGDENLFTFSNFFCLLGSKQNPTFFFPFANPFILKDIANRSMDIASDMCVYTNKCFRRVSLPNKAEVSTFEGEKGKIIEMEPAKH